MYREKEIEKANIWKTAPLAPLVRPTVSTLWGYTMRVLMTMSLKLIQ